MTFDDLDKVSNNPGRALTTLFSAIEAEMDTATVGTINGKADPFTFMMDALVGTHSIMIGRISDAVAGDYKTHARSIADLSNHMSDEDWEGVFGSPSTTTLRYTIPVDEIRRLSKDFTSIDGDLTSLYKKLVIPKDTRFILPDVTFLLGHAVEFRLMEHGGVQVLYDTTQSNPFSDLGTNYPERDIFMLKGEQYVSVLLPVKQLAIKEIPNKSSNDIVGFSLTDTYDDKLYRIRAFITPWGSTQRTEMTVVFKRTNFDKDYPTIVIDLLDNNQFTATIPSVYLQNGLGLGDVTLLVYTTKGFYERDLTSLVTSYHKAEYFNYNNTKGVLNTYESNIVNVDGVTITSETPITGGNDGESFIDLKNRMIYGHRKRDVPISDIDVSQIFKENGYATIKALDYPNYRMYRVTKDLPVQANKVYDNINNVSTNSSMGIYVGSTLSSLEEIVSLGIAKDNGSRLTILPGSVIDVSSSTPKFYNQLTTDQLLSATMKTKVDVSLNQTLVALPFHYVLDTTNSQARLRAYYLEKPYIINQSFFYENAYLGLSLGINKGGITITNVGNSYVIDLVTTSSDAYKQLPDSVLGIQLGINIKDGYGSKTTKGFLVGKNSDGERLWRFIIDTDFDIDSDDLIYLKGFRQYGEAKKVVSANLTETLNFIFTFQGDNTKEKSTSDIRIDQTLFSGVHTAIVETEFSVRFGVPLKELYTSIRPMIGSEQYLKYTENVPDLYNDTIFKYENNELVIEDGKAVILHRAGDPILDDSGNPKYLHRIDDIVYDASGVPILKEPRKILYYWDFLGFDYNYYLSQDEYDLEYRDSIKENIAVTIMGDLGRIIRNRLERTVVMFKPKSSIGYTDVVVNENIHVEIKNDLRFSIIYYLSHEGLLDNNLKSTLMSATHRAINEYRNKSTLSSSGVVKVLHDPAQQEIKDVKVSIFSGDQAIDVITNLDNTNGFGVRKKLSITADNFLTVKEDIEIIFKEHMKKSDV